MKNLLILLLLSTQVCLLRAADLEPIRLNSPDKSRGTSVMEAFSVRASVREWSDRKLNLQDLSDLLWAANGINRPDEGKRTAPSAMNLQDVDVYVLAEEGAYRYDAASHLLAPVREGDHRGLTGKQDSPVVLVLISDISKFTRGDEISKLTMASLDAGIVSQNISLFCAGTGLKTRPRAGMDKEKLKEVLSLTDSQLPLLNHPVGYAK